MIAKVIRHRPLTLSPYNTLIRNHLSEIQTIFTLSCSLCCTPTWRALFLSLDDEAYGFSITELIFMPQYNGWQVCYHTTYCTEAFLVVLNHEEIDGRQILQLTSTSVPPDAASFIHFVKHFPETAAIRCASTVVDNSVSSSFSSALFLNAFPSYSLKRASVTRRELWTSDGWIAI